MTVTKEPFILKKEDIKFTPEKESATERKQTIQTWRSGIAGAIERVLAPKGYSKIKIGPFRGAEKSTIDFLSKRIVMQVQNVAVNTFDMYRNGVKQRMTRQIELNLKGIEQANVDLSKAPFWKFALRTAIKETIIRLKGQNEAMKQVIEEMNYIEVK